MGKEKNLQRSGVRISSGARLHFGIVDLSGETRRIDGGSGLCLVQPRTTVCAYEAQTLSLENPKALTPFLKRLRPRLEEVLGIQTGRVVVDEMLPRHVGFGSGTQIALAIAVALLWLRDGKVPSISTLGAALGRGGTSGIGVHGFDQGGLLVDGGRAWPKAKSEMEPSRFCEFENPPPLLLREDFPSWGICVALPREIEHGPAGLAERRRFKELVPIPVEEVREASHLILLELIPAVIEKDFEGFCLALEGLGCTGMKKRQWRVAPKVVHEAAEWLQTAGFRGIGLSSWGPVTFGFSESIELSREMVQRAGIPPEKFDITVTEGRNVGYTLQPNPEAADKLGTK